jgi:autophagy-related protein 9
MSKEEYQLLIQEPDPSTLLYNNNEGSTVNRDNFINRIKNIIKNEKKKINAFLLPKPKGKDLLKDKSDEFYQEIYDYYRRKGFACIVLERISHLVTIAFVICFSVFLFGCIDYSLISENSQLSQVIVDQCVYQLNWKIKFFLSGFIILWLYLFINYFSEFMRLRKIYYFYNCKLKIPDRDIQLISWNAVIKKIIKLYNEENQELEDQSEIEELDAHKIVNIIMRKENYFIALINKECIKFNIPFFESKQLLTDILAWNVQWCINNFVYDKNGHVKEYFLDKEKKLNLSRSLSQRFRLMGIINIILLPFLLIFTIVYTFFRYSEEIYHHPGSIMKRTYNLLAQWKFRQFNELPHDFEKRLNRSYESAMTYLNQFPNSRITIISKLIVFISGSIVTVLTILTLIDQDFFNSFEITPGGSVLFYIGIFTSILAFTKGMINEDTKEYDPQILIENVAQETHYYPKKWREESYSDEVRNEFEGYFDKKIFIIFRNIYGLILTPFILMITLPTCSYKIINFFQEFTVNLSSVGYVCSFAVFDFRKHGNPEYGYKIKKNDEIIDEDSEAEDKKENENENKSDNDNNKQSDENNNENKKENKYSNEGKMELSFLDFRAHYDSWIPKKETGGLEYSSYINDSKLKRYPMLTSQMMLNPTSIKGKEPEITSPYPINSAMYSSSLIFSVMEDMIHNNNINSSRINYAIVNQVRFKIL